MPYTEINFDGLVGPSHNFAGLSSGNVASMSHKGSQSNPRAAALQGLQKAKALADRGFPQAILPPADRPCPGVLSQWGITGKCAQEILGNAAARAPELLAAASSASSMWTANACTMTPSCDAMDGRVHFTPANLSAKLHRSIEASFTTRLLREIFSNDAYFTVHDPLPGGDAMADEGAANHTRFCSGCRDMGMHLFVYGRSALDSQRQKPAIFPARQTLESCHAIAGRHGIATGKAMFMQQSPAVIDAGVFHNDVISVGDHNVFLFHAAAFVDTRESVRALQQGFYDACGEELRLVPVSRDQLSVAAAVSSYLFNSQLLKKADGSHLLVIPADCLENPQVSQLLSSFVEDSDNPISEFLSFDLRQSMNNGGGPACLRNRIVLNDDERRGINGRVLLDDALFSDLQEWILRHYRDSIEPSDLADPSLLTECRETLDALSAILRLPALYSFQR